MQNVLARSRFDAAKWLVLVPIGYTAALCFQAPRLAKMTSFDAFTRIIQTLGISCVALCAVAAWFCRDRRVTGDAADRDLAPAPATSDKSSSQVA